MTFLTSMLVLLSAAARSDSTGLPNRLAAFLRRPEPSHGPGVVPEGVERTAYR